MITRVYADNFRCLVNFELRLDRLNLLMGANGTGKSSVFDVVRNLQSFLAGDGRTTELFPAQERTQWVQSAFQRFELGLDISGAAYRYGLTIEHADASKSRVQEETLAVDGKPLFSSRDGEAQLFYDNHTPGPSVSFDSERSGVGIVPAGSDHTRLATFRREMDKIVIASIAPFQMESLSRAESPRLSRRMENFVSWLRRLSHEHLEAMLEVFEQLKQVLPGFRSFRLLEAGEDSKEMKVVFDHPDDSRKSFSLDFRQLSDGQRAMIALYTLIHGLRNERLTLLLDEPDNYVSLREIQPWLTSLEDACGEQFEQAVLISHHPEIINYLGSSSGRWFSRAETGYVLVQPQSLAPTNGLSLSETIARGWEG